RVAEQASSERAMCSNHGGCRIRGDHLVSLAMARTSALSTTQFDRPGWSKPVTESEAASPVYGLSGFGGGNLDRTLTRVLWPYWEDATRPVHVPKEFPPDMDAAEQERTHADWRRRLFGTA